MAEQASDSPRVRTNPLFREIHKNTWLKRVPINDSKKKKEKVWVVFCVHDDTEAFLEGYTDNKLSVLHKPDWCVSLNYTQHISPTICPNDQEYEFVITLNNEIIRLAATSWDLMSEWVESLRSKLQELKVLSPKENLYSKLPEPRSTSLFPTRDPMSPLPPTPTAVTPITGGLEISARRHPVLQRGISLPEPFNNATSTVTPSIVVSSNPTNNITIIQVENSNANQRNDIFNFESPRMNDIDNYERLFERVAGPSNASHVRRTPPACPLQPAPQPYRTLREQQVIELQGEIQHPGGVKLQLRRKDCISAIALVDALGSVWVSGWKQKEHPMLYNALHIGDQLLSAEGAVVHNAAEAYKLLRSTQSLYVDIVVRRVPFGRVFVIRRDMEGQPLGIIQDGNTAVIQTITPDSLAARHGLSVRAQTCDGLSFTNWVLTEINGRPLNLFCKENQVRDRLNSVGRDISILVQPLDLIKQLKKQLKSIRNYKDYVLQ